MWLPPGKPGELPLETAARRFASDRHRGQKRKYTDDPYILHPQAVADIVRSVTPDESMLAAAWLHDVLEDCRRPGENLALLLFNTFGSYVWAMVAGLTDTEIGTNRADRKAKSCARLAKVWPETQTIKLADLIHNSASIMQYDPKFAKVYLAEKRDLLKVLTKGDATLHARATEIVNNATRT